MALECTHDSTWSLAKTLQMYSSYSWDVKQHGMASQGSLSSDAIVGGTATQAAKKPLGANTHVTPPCKNKEPGMRICESEVPGPRKEGSLEVTVDAGIRGR